MADTKSLKDDSGTYMGYNIHVNGIFHCTLRYRQIHYFHEQLKKEFGANTVPIFPPKRILPLSAAQLEERRVSLEKYVQLVGQDQQLLHTDLFNGFLLSAQQETFYTPDSNQQVDLDVFLMNGFKISLTVLTCEDSEQILKKTCAQINLPVEYINYFSLFLIKREENGNVTVVRKLSDFESPYISQKSIHAGHQLVLRKSYWDPAYDLELMNDRVALNLLYVQTVADIKRGWVLTSKESLHELASLQARGAKREYLDLARTLKYYAFLQFQPCLCDYPHAGSNVLVSIGNRELNLRVRLESGDEIREGSFKVTRMRCWRITTLQNDETTRTNDGLSGDSSVDQPQLELSFEYLMAKDKLQWITVASDQAILMSVCLQSMVDELLLKKTGEQRKWPSNGHRNGGWSYMKRDGSSQPMIQQPESDNVGSSMASDGLKQPIKTSSISSMKRLTGKLTGVGYKSSTKPTPTPFVENDAFEGIGDDDL